MTAYFSLETMQRDDSGATSLKYQRKNCQPTIL